MSDTAEEIVYEAPSKAHGLGEDHNFRTFMADMDSRLASAKEDSRNSPKSFRRDSPADQAIIRNAELDKLGPQADAIMSGYRDSLAQGPSVHEPGIDGLGGTRTRPEDYEAQRHSQAASPAQRQPTPEEMMRMADELEQDMVDQHDRSLIKGSYLHPEMERDQTTELYVPHTHGYNPPEWLAKYMENVPTTGTTMVDPLGHQRYSQDKERLKKLKALR